MGYYNRYNEFVSNGDYIIVPHIKITAKASDRKISYKVKN